jgi:hypothetical protein
LRLWSKITAAPTILLKLLPKNLAFQSSNYPVNHK